MTKCGTFAERPPFKDVHLGAERHPFNDVQQKYHVLQWLRNKTQVIRAKPKDSIHRFDLLMRFVDCSRSSYASIQNEEDRSHL